MNFSVFCTYIIINNTTIVSIAFKYSYFSETISHLFVYGLPSEGGGGRTKKSICGRLLKYMYVTGD